MATLPLPRGAALLGVVAAGLFAPGLLRAETPVMSMVPRWDYGYGWQVFHKYRDDTLVDAPNPNGLFARTHETEFGAVFTWDRSIRLVGTVPYYWREEAQMVDGERVERSGQGFGDLELILPLRQYFNGRGYSGNISLNPKVELPTGDDDGPIAFSDGSTDWGLGISAEREDPRTIIAAGVTYWWEGEPGLGNRVSADGKVGLMPNPAMQLTLEFDYDFRADGLNAGFSRLRLGPAWFWWIDRTVLFKVGYNFNVHESRERPGLGGGDEFRIGLGMAY